MRRATAPLVFALLAAVGALAVPSARSASPDLVVSQVFAGGGNTGAPFANDFVELFNRGSTAVDVGGWTVQYASSGSATWQVTTLSGSIAPGRHYLVQLAGGSVGAALPTPDATGASNLAVSGGKVAVARDATPLACGATAGSCASVAAIADLVGYGTAADYEGSGAAPAIDNTTAATRAGDGCVDTDANASDLTAATPAPRNSASPVVTCGATPPPPGGVSQSATVDVDIQSVLSIALERSAVSFGNATTGSTPTPVSERVTVVSNNATGYAVTVHRSAFLPADLPLGVAGTAPAGGQIGPALVGGAIAGIPVAPAADLLVGTTSARSADAGDVWATSLGFTGPLPAVPAGRYTAAVTFTVIGR
ncbi:MAG: lamin tail domain-containing protein [Gaiella sp.]|nr:lamin tail domain-containing protein [Gaiella sp.]